MNEIIAAPDATSYVASDVVPFGTPSATEMAEKYNGFARKTAESVLNMAKVVSDMKAQKDKVEFEKFCDLINCKPESSYIRKFIQIGKKFDFLIANADKLPSQWTTVYQISKLSNDAIGTLIEKGSITPSLSGVAVARVLGATELLEVKTKPTAKKVVPNGTTIGVSFEARRGTFPSAVEVRRLNRIIADLKEMNFEIATSPNLDELVDESMLAIAA